MIVLEKLIGYIAVSKLFGNFVEQAVGSVMSNIFKVSSSLLFVAVVRHRITWVVIAACSDRHTQRAAAAIQ